MATGQDIVGPVSGLHLFGHIRCLPGPSVAKGLGLEVGKKYLYDPLPLPLFPHAPFPLLHSLPSVPAPPPKK